MLNVTSERKKMISRLQEALINLAIELEVRRMERDKELQDLLVDKDIAEAIDNLIPAARDQYGNWYVEEGA